MRSGNKTTSIILIVLGFFFFSVIPGIFHLVGVSKHQEWKEIQENRKLETDFLKSKLKEGN